MTGFVFQPKIDQSILQKFKMCKIRYINLFKISQDGIKRTALNSLTMFKT